MGIFRSVREKWLGVIWLMGWGMAGGVWLRFWVGAEIERRGGGAQSHRRQTFIDGHLEAHTQAPSQPSNTLHLYRLPSTAQLLPFNPFQQSLHHLRRIQPMIVVQHQIATGPLGQLQCFRLAPITRQLDYSS